MNAFRRWLQHPEKSAVRHILFQIHLCLGAALSMYILLMSMTGSVIVFRNQLSPKFPVEWLVNLHENLLAGSIGRIGNGIGALCLTLLCLTRTVIW